MSVFLAVTPAEAASCRGYRVPLVHIAYAVGDGGRLLRSELPRGAQGGLLGLSDRCNGPLPLSLIHICLYAFFVTVFDLFRLFMNASLYIFSV